MAIVRKKWKRFPRGSDKLLDVNLRAICSILQHVADIVYVRDPKVFEDTHDRKGRPVKRRVRVYGSYDPEKDIISIDLPKLPQNEASKQDHIRRIVRTAIHEAIEKLRHKKMWISFSHEHIRIWERCIFERMNEAQISYVWSLLPPPSKE